MHTVVFRKVASSGLFCSYPESGVSNMQIPRKNFWIHLLEGALYMSTGVLLSPQTVFPALIAKLGGGNVLIGCVPIIVYLAFFVPQLFSANYVRTVPFRKPLTLSLGIAQRMLIFLFAVLLGLVGKAHPGWALTAFFVIYITNQVLAGFTSPIWFDFVMKTISSHERGKLMGLRISSGALLGLLNSFLLTILLSYLVFPLSYAAVFGVAFLFQFASWIVQRNVDETEPTRTETLKPLSELFGRVRTILKTDKIFFRFLVSAGFLTIGLMPYGFFTVTAMRTLNLSESYVGVFTVTTVVAQIVSGGFLGWLSDRTGHKNALLICSTSLMCAIALALVASSVEFYIAVFFFVGVNLGAETMTRYNFAVSRTSDTDRPIYVGLMNAWLAPFYISATLGGWLIDLIGYAPVFVIGLLSAGIGLVLLMGLPSGKAGQLAVSLK
jgi:MFS family permease